MSHPDFLVSFESFLVSLPLIAAVLLKQNGTGSNYIGIGLNLFIELVAALEFKVISGKSIVLVKPVSDRTHPCEAAGWPRR